MRKFSFGCILELHTCNGYRHPCDGGESMNFNRKNTLLICLVITLVMAYVAWLQHAAMQASVKRGALDVLGNYDRQIESILRIRERHSRELADSLQTDPAFLSLFEQSEQGGLVAVRDGFDAFFPDRSVPCFASNIAACRCSARTIPACTV